MKKFPSAKVPYFWQKGQMATCGSYSKTMLAPWFPQYRNSLLDTPKFMPAPPSLVFLRVARLPPVPHSLPSSLSLAVLYSFLLTSSYILLSPLFFPILRALAMASLRLSLSSLDSFSLFTYNETLNHTMGWLPHSYLVSMPSPSLAANCYCTPSLCHYQS